MLRMATADGTAACWASDWVDGARPVSRCLTTARDPWLPSGSTCCSRGSSNESGSRRIDRACVGVASTSTVSAGEGALNRAVWVWVGREVHTVLSRLVAGYKRFEATQN